MNLHDPMRTEATGENQQGSLIETEAPHWTAEAFGHIFLDTQKAPFRDSQKFSQGGNNFKRLN